MNLTQVALAAFLSALGTRLGTAAADLLIDLGGALVAGLPLPLA